MAEPHVNIVSRDNAFGLTKSMSVLRETLTAAGIHVSVSRLSAPSILRPTGILARWFSQRIANRLIMSRHHSPARRFDANIFIEGIRPEWFDCARANLFIPNLEWLRDEQRALLPRMDAILCQTRHAAGVLSGLGYAAQYVGFTSVDRYLPTERRSLDTALHVAGNSMEKGTQALIDLWSKRPDWPTLVVVHRRPLDAPTQAPNVRHISRYLSDAEIAAMQNSCALHICPSEVESFGHYIVEAMSCRALTVVTDAPPMNEIAGPDRALMVGYASSAPQRLGEKYLVDAGLLEAKVSEALSMTEAERTRIGESARRWFLANRESFARNIADVVRNL